MSCSGNCNKNCYQKSCERYFNTAAQTIDAGTSNVLQLAGTKVVDSGISIEVEPSSYTIVRPGLYHVACDFDITGSAVGLVTAQLYLDGVPLPCTLRTFTLGTSGTTTVHTETDLSFTSCLCNPISKIITVVVSSSGTGAGVVDNLCTGVLKLA